MPDKMPLEQALLAILNAVKSAEKMQGGTAQEAVFTVKAKNHLGVEECWSFTVERLTPDEMKAINDEIQNIEKGQSDEKADSQLQAHTIH